MLFRSKVDYEAIRLRHNYKSIITDDFEYKISIGESIHLKEVDMVLSTRILDYFQVLENSADKHIECFDLNKIKREIVVRNRRKGDRFNPLGMAGSKKLKDFFIDEKVPRDIRDHIPLVCDGDEIIWIVGHRASERYKIEYDTKRVLEISCNGKE